MSRTKSFGYPISPADLHLFSCPDKVENFQEDGLSYYVTEWWALRTKQYCGHPDGTLSKEAAAGFNRLEALPESAWRPLADMERLINKFPVAIWERTHLRHHLLTYPIVRVGYSYSQRGILQLCTRLPNAMICITGGNTDPVFIKFTGGAIVLRPLPWAETTTVALNLWTKL